MNITGIQIIQYINIYNKTKRENSDLTLKLIKLFPQLE